MGTPERRCERCGAHLSRYNPATCCAACTAAGPLLPPALWQLGPVRDALAVDDIGAVLVGYREALRISQAELANLLSDDALNFSQPKVSRIESGAPVKHIDDRRRISQALGIPAELLGLASDRSFTAVSLVLRPTASVAVGEVTSDMRRRTVLTGAAALVGWTIMGPLAEPVERKVGHAHVAQVEDALTQLWALDDRYGGDDTHQLAVGLLQRVHALLNYGTYTEPTGQRLQVLAGRLAEHAGWLSFDAERQDQARYYLTEALTAARVAANEELEVLVLGSLSVQASHVGRHREAVAFAARAQDSPVVKRTPAAYVMAAFREARAHAVRGDRGSAHAAMLRAEQAFDRQGEPPAWVAYLDSAELAAKIAFTRAALGEAGPAVAGFEQALAAQQAGYARNRALYSAYLAHAHLANQEVEQAATVGIGALDLAEQVTSSRTLDQVATLRRQLGQHLAIPAARDYVEQYDARFGPLVEPSA